MFVFLFLLFFFFFKQKTAYEMRISDWSSDVCSSDLEIAPSDDTLNLFYPLIQKPYWKEEEGTRINVCSSSLTLGYAPIGEESRAGYYPHDGESPAPVNLTGLDARLILGLIKFEGLNESFDQMAEVSLVKSEEHTSELQSLMRISYAVFCLKKKKNIKPIKHQPNHSN